MEDERGRSSHVVTKHVHGRRHYKKGEKVFGRCLDTRWQPQLFDGNKLHFTKAFRGPEKYAVVFFVHSHGQGRIPALM